MFRGIQKAQDRISTESRRLMSPILGSPALRELIISGAEKTQQKRRQSRSERQAKNPVAIFPHVRVGQIDLYAVFVTRMGADGLGAEPFYNIDNSDFYYSKYKSEYFTTWFNLPNLRAIPKNQLFYCFICILFGCDKAHDFTKEVVKRNLNKPKFSKKIPYDWFGKNLNAIFNYILNANVEQVKDAIEDAYNAYPANMPNWQTLFGYCVCIINIELARNSACGNSAYDTYLTLSPLQYGTDTLTAFFKTDSTAKDVVTAISRILGISIVDYEAVMPINMRSSAHVADLLTPRPGTFKSWEDVQIRIDATSASINHIDDFKDLTDGNERAAVILDSASANDPAGIGALEKVFNLFGRVSEQYDRKVIDAYVTLNGTRVNILKAELAPEGLPAGAAINAAIINPEVVPKINIKVDKFLSDDMTSHDIVPNQNSISSVMEKILDKWFSYKDQSIVLSVQNKTSFDYTIKKLTMEKTLGDFIQIITYAATPYPKVFITFDYIACSIAGILGPTAILDDGTGTGARRFVFRRLFVTSKFVEHKSLSALGWCGAALTQLVRNRFFGKINNISKRIKFMKDSELKNKLKSVGIKITKNVKCKRKYLTRKELENKALLFNKLQNTAKKMKIKLMYISRNGLYKYKTYKRLQKEINSKKINSKYNINRGYKKPVVRNFNFG